MPKTKLGNETKDNGAKKAKFDTIKCEMSPRLDEGRDDAFPPARPAAHDATSMGTGAALDARRVSAATGPGTGDHLQLLHEPVGGATSTMAAVL